MPKKEQFKDRLKTYRLMLPPLCGFTDYPYRRILSSFHPPFVTTEMVKARAIAEKNNKTFSMIKQEKGDHWKGVQILGCDPLIMAKAAEIVEALGFDYIDINMGCTVKKVASRGEGITLMKDEKLAIRIAKEVSLAVTIPVTVKLRTGFSKERINVIELSKKLAETGIQAITVHGRTGEKKFGVDVDWSIIRKTASAIRIPVIANGGIFSGPNALRMQKETGAEAVMPGRGLLGNPWIIPEILSAFSGTTFHSPSLMERKKTFKTHLAYLVEEYGERSAIMKMRKILPWYFSTCHNLKNLRIDAQTISTLQDVRSLIKRTTRKDSHSVYEPSLSDLAEGSHLRLIKKL